MLYCFFFITVFIGLSHPKSKYVAMWVFVFSWLLFAGNDNNNDFLEYKEKYEYLDKDVLLEPGYGLLNYLFRSLGFDFMMFKALISFLGLLLIYRTIWKLTDYKALVATLYLIYPFIIDITQIRNFIASSIVIFAIPLLFQKGISSIFKYVAFVLTAATVHSAAFFYLVFIVAKRKIGIRLILIGLAAVVSIKVTVYSLFQARFETEKLDVYEKPSIVGGLIMAFLICITAYVIIQLSKRRNKSESQSGSLSSAFVNERIWPNIAMLTILIVPLCFDNASFTRIYRNLILFNMLFVANAYYIKWQRRKLLITLFMLYFTSSYVLGTGWEYVVSPIFSYNIFLK